MIGSRPRCVMRPVSASRPARFGRHGHPSRGTHAPPRPAPARPGRPGRLRLDGRGRRGPDRLPAGRARPLRRGHRAAGAAAPSAVHRDGGPHAAGRGGPGPCLWGRAVPGRDARRCPARPVPAPGDGEGAWTHPRGPRRRGGCRGIHLRRGRGARGQPGRRAAGVVAGLHRRGAVRAPLPGRGHRRGPARADGAHLLRGRVVGRRAHLLLHRRGPRLPAAPGLAPRDRHRSGRRRARAAGGRPALRALGAGHPVRPVDPDPRREPGQRRDLGDPGRRPDRRPGHRRAVGARGTSTWWSRSPTGRCPSSPSPTTAGRGSSRSAGWALGETDPSRWRPAIDAPLPGDPEVAGARRSRRPPVPVRRFMAVDAFAGHVVVTPARVRGHGPVRGPGRRARAWTGLGRTRCARPRGRSSSWRPTSSSTRRS